MEQSDAAIVRMSLFEGLSPKRGELAMDLARMI